MKRPPVRAIAVCIDTRDGAGRNRLHGVARCVRALGWRMMLVRHSGKEAADEVARLKPGGIIAYVADHWLLEVARRLSVPLVDTAFGELNVAMSVSVDNQAVGRLAAEHLIETGLKHFGYCGVSGRLASEQRRLGFAHYLEPRLLHAFSQPVSEGESQLNPLMKWLRELPKPAGLLVFDDKLGERVLTACRWANLAVPEQVAVLGIGDDELMCEVSWPTLSSIRLPTAHLGYEAAAMLALAMTGKTVTDPHRTIQPSGVVARGSTDTVAVEDPLIRSAVRFIRAEAASAIGASQVAQALKVSTRTLDRRFQTVLDRTTHEEIVRVRMHMARNLLMNGTLRLADVASQCGYASAAAFSRAFHQHCGQWPSEYAAMLS